MEQRVAGRFRQQGVEPHVGFGVAAEAELGTRQDTLGGCKLLKVVVGAVCGSGTFNCAFDVGVYLDGKPVPGTYGHALLEPNSNLTETFQLFGIATDVAAGSHTLTVGWLGESPNHASPSVEFGESHLGAIALGG